nr:MAG TPA: hypothetical protein [Caudoviricetes sp.]
MIHLFSSFPKLQSFILIGFIITYIPRPHTPYLEAFQNNNSISSLISQVVFPLK